MNKLYKDSKNKIFFFFVWRGGGGGGGVRGVEKGWGAELVEFVKRIQGSKSKIKTKFFFVGGGGGVRGRGLELMNFFYKESN